MNILNSVSIWNADLQQVAQSSVSGIDELLGSVLPKAHADLYMGMVFGTPVVWDAEIRHLFEVMGIQHIFSASGYNISVIIGLLQFWLNGRFSRGALGLCMLLFVAWYCYLAGWQTSLVRAFAMFIYALGATNFLFRQYRPLFGLCVACFIIVLIDQSFLTSISFQLSAAATFGMALFSPLLQHASTWLTALESGSLGRLVINQPTSFKAKALAFLGEGLLVSLAAQVFSLPIILYHFGTLSTISLLANLCLFWLVPYLFIAGLAGSVLLVLLRFLPGFDWAATLVGWVLWFPAELFFKIVFAFSAFDWTFVRLSQFGIGYVVAWWSVVLLFWHFYSVRTASARSRKRLLSVQAINWGSPPP